MTLIDFITAQAARLKQAGVSFGHGTTNAFDESAWLVLWALGMELDALEAKARRELSADEQAKAQALLSDYPVYAELPLDAIRQAAGMD